MPTSQPGGSTAEASMSPPLAEPISSPSFACLPALGTTNTTATGVHRCPGHVTLHGTITHEERAHASTANVSAGVTSARAWSNNPPTQDCCAVRTKCRAMRQPLKRRLVGSTLERRTHLPAGGGGDHIAMPRSSQQLQPRKQHTRRVRCACCRGGHTLVPASRPTTSVLHSRACGPRPSALSGSRAHSSALCRRT